MTVDERANPLERAGLQRRKCHAHVRGTGHWTEQGIINVKETVERADTLRHRPVEAADLLDHLGGHYLTLVRYREKVNRIASLLARWRDSSVGRAHD